MLAGSLYKHLFFHSHLISFFCYRPSFFSEIQSGWEQSCENRCQCIWQAPMYIIAHPWTAGLSLVCIQALVTLKKSVNHILLFTYREVKSCSGPTQVSPVLGLASSSRAGGWVMFLALLEREGELSTGGQQLASHMLAETAWPWWSTPMKFSHVNMRRLQLWGGLGCWQMAPSTGKLLV